MATPRKVALFDAQRHSEAWNERMVPGEYAVHFSHFAGDASVIPYCWIFSDLDQAVAYAQDEVRKTPTLRCTIYDHHGLVGAPIRDIRGVDFKDGGFSPRLARWIGSMLFFGGTALTIYDWTRNSQLQWPTAIGMPMVVPGLTLLFADIVSSVHKKWHHTRAGAKGVA